MKAKYVINFPLYTHEKGVGGVMRLHACVNLTVWAVAVCVGLCGAV